jgi:PAS domain S-box-containing protein
MRTDPKFKPWYAEAIKRGYVSSLVLPLLSGGQAFGALTIYSEVPDPFSEDEIKLLSELVYDLAYGITTLRLRTANLKAEEALRASEERYCSLFAGMTEGFALHEIICDENGQPCDYRFLEINPAFERLTGLKQEDVIGKLHNQVLPDDDPNWAKIYGKVALTGQPVHFENYSPALKQHYEVFAYCPAPRQFAVLFMNITACKHMEDVLKRAHDELEQRVQERTEQLHAINEELNAEIEERKQAEEIIRQNAARAENLAEISRHLAAVGLDLQKVCDIISQSMAELIGDTCVVRLLSEDGRQLNLASIYHPDPAHREQLSTIMRDLPIRVGEGISGKVIKTGRSFFLPATAPHKLTGLIEPQEQPVVEEMQIYSLMCVPLRQEEKIIGTIAVMGSP